MHIDPFSITVFNIVISFMMSAGLFVVARNYLFDVKGLRHWATALSLMSIAWTLLALNNVIPKFFSIVIGTITGMSAIVSYFKALAEFKECRVSMRWLYVIMVIAFIGNVYFIEIRFDMAAKISITSTCASILLFSNSALLTFKRFGLSTPTHRVTAIIFAIGGCIYFIRAIYYLIYNTYAEQNLFNVNFIQDISYITNSIIIVGTSFGVAMMYIEKYITESKETEFKQQALIDRNKLLMDEAPEGIHILDEHGYVLEANLAFCRSLGYSKNEVQLLNISDWEAKIFGDELLTNLEQLQNTEKKHLTFETLHRRKDGSIIDVEMNVVNIELDGKKCFFALSKEITERKQAEIDLRISATVFEAQEGMFITDVNSIILKVNHTFTVITGYSSIEAVGQTPHMLSSGQHDKDFYNKIWQTVNNSGSWQGEIWNRRKNGEIYPEWLTITSVKSISNNVITHYVATLTDITERKATEKQIHELAFYDPLTQLPNRRLLQDRIKQGIKVSQRMNSQLAVLILDLDNFKAVNDTFGHSAGDDLLKQACERIKIRLRKMDTLARLGGDEFVILVENITETELISHLANNIIDTLKQPFLLLEHYEAQIGTSIGIAFYPQHGDNMEGIMDNADAALYRAKASGRGCFAYFSE